MNITDTEYEIIKIGRRWRLRGQHDPPSSHHFFDDFYMLKVLIIRIMKIPWLVKMFLFWLVFICSHVGDYDLFSSPGLVVTSAMQLVVSTRVVTAGVAHHHLSHILMRAMILVLY